jgi:L-ascorbate metabolism protein UlaG (beta-lactamase superfamily)
MWSMGLLADTIAEWRMIHKCSGLFETDGKYPDSFCVAARVMIREGRCRQKEAVMKLRYFSHSSFLLTLESGINILIDPFLDGNPTSPVQAKEVDADYILISHGHGDHLGDTLAIAKRCNSLCICENELASYIAAQGARAHNMHIGGSFEFEFGRVKLTPALHSSVTPDNQCVGAATGILIYAENRVLYHTGDTGLFSDMKLIGEIDAIDCMMVPIGDNFTMGIDDAVRACRFVNPGFAVPMHYNTFDVIQSDPHQFRTKLEDQGIHCRVMDFGAQIEL